MSVCSDMWMENVEAICEDFAFDKITRREALDKLSRLGLGQDEAQNLLNGAIA